MGDYFSTPLTEFQAQCLTMVSALVHNQGSLFCLFNRAGKPEHLVRNQLDVQVANRFLDNSTSLNTQYADSPCSVIVDQFVVPTGTACFASLIFRRQQRIDGLLGVVRYSDRGVGVFEQDDLKRLSIVHPVIGHVLTRVYLGSDAPRVH